MPTSSKFEYKGWNCKAGRAGITGGYDGEARKDGIALRTERRWGDGAKSRVQMEIKEMIDKIPESKEEI